MTDVLLLRRQLNELTKRVARLEETIRLNLLRAPLPPREGPPPAERPLPIEFTPMPAAPEVEDIAPEFISSEPFPPDLSAAPVEHLEPEAAPGHRAREFLSPGDREAWDLEQLVAGRWYAIAGALIVVIGMGLFLKLGVERGWFTMPPTARCITAAAFGALLLVAGEWVRRRSRDWAAAALDVAERTNVPVHRFAEYAPIGLNAAGVGTIYAAAYAAYGMYSLVGPTVGFILLSAAAAVGIAVGVRARQVSVAAVGLVGGYLSLFLVRTQNPSPLVLPAYLTALLLVGLGVCFTMGGRFVVLRSLVWWATMLIGGAWATQVGPAHPAIVIGFLSLVCIFIHTELVASARLRGLVGVEWPQQTFAAQWNFARPFATSLSTTTWSVALATYIIHQLAGAEWVPAAIACAATASLAAFLVRPRQLLLQAPKTDTERLGLVLALEAGAALIAAIALAASGWMQVAAWLALGAGAVAAGTSIRARGLHIYGLVVLAIAAGRVLALDWWAGTLHTGGTQLAGLVLTRWTLLMVLTGASWIFAGVMVSRRRGAQEVDPIWPVAGALCAGLGIALIGASLLHTNVEPASLSIAWMLISLAAVTVSRLAPVLCTDRVGLAGLVFATGAWTLANAPYPSEEWNTLTSLPLLSPALGLGLLLAGAFAGAAWWISRKPGAWEPDRMAAAIGAAATVVVALLASMSEVARVATSLSHDDTVRHAAVSIWWGLFGVGLIVTGFLRRVTAARHCGLALLGIAAAKAVIFDLASVRPEARVASFIGLGLLMIGVAVLYARVSVKFDKQPH